MKLDFKGEWERDPTNVVLSLVGLAVSIGICWSILVMGRLDIATSFFFLSLSIYAAKLWRWLGKWQRIEATDNHQGD